MLSQFLLSSFKYQELIIAREISREIKLDVLAEEDFEKALKLAKELEAYSFHPNQENVKQRHIINAKKDGFKVFVFTVNDEKELDQLKQWQVDGVFTDLPNRIRN